MLATAALADDTGMPVQITPEMRAEARKVAMACQSDLHAYCAGVSPGGGRILACLKPHRDDLTPPCHAALAQAVEVFAASR
ncbi:MAG: hypothetical protein GC186_15325 [Rhodobacteraceae bacterium]|nr:hypothetical protein [Paracoccaceae bacterium]